MIIISITIDVVIIIIKVDLDFLVRSNVCGVRVLKFESASNISKHDSFVWHFP